MLKSEIEKIKREIERVTKDHILTEEINNNGIRSYLFKRPESGTYWMRAIETNYGLHLEGDCGCLQICYKTFEWLAHGDSIDYQMSKLDVDFNEQKTVSKHAVKSLIQNMIQYVWENREDRREELKKQAEWSYRNPNKKVILFTDEERDFFEELRACDYDPNCSVEEFYRRIYDLSGWENYFSDGAYITDYSDSIYWRFFWFKKIAQEIVKSFKRSGEK